MHRYGGTNKIIKRTTSMKPMRYMLLAATTLVLALSGCHTEEPFDTQTPDDYPLILKPYNESGTGSYPNKFNICFY